MQSSYYTFRVCQFPDPRIRQSRMEEPADDAWKPKGGSGTLGYRAARECPRSTGKRLMGFSDKKGFLHLDRDVTFSRPIVHPTAWRDHALAASSATSYEPRERTSHPLPYRL